MKNCNDYIVLMHMYIDGEAVDERALFAHLEQCPGCKSLFDEYSALAQAARALPLEVPDTLHASIMRAVTRERRLKLARRAAKVALPLAACAAIAAVVLLPGDFKLADMTGGAAANQYVSRSFGAGAPASPTMAATAADSGNGENSDSSSFKTTAEPPAGAAGGANIADSTVEGESFTLSGDFEYPPVAFSRAFARYIVAAGGGDLPDFGDASGAVAVHYDSGEAAYLIVETGALESVLHALADAGFAVDADVEDAPLTDIDAGVCLIVIATAERE